MPLSLRRVLDLDSMQARVGRLQQGSMLFLVGRDFGLSNRLALGLSSGKEFELDAAPRAVDAGTLNLEGNAGWFECREVKRNSRARRSLACNRA